jgi:hypothetical protein
MGKILCCFILMLFSLPAQAEEKKILEEKGVFYLEGPDRGYHWEKIKKDKREDKISSYYAVKAGAKTILILVVSDSKEETIDEKNEFVTQYFKDRLHHSKKSSAQILDLKEPKVESDQASRTDCWMKLKSPDKEPEERHITFLFKKRTYIFEAQGPGKDHPRKLLDQFVSQFKEVKKD